MGVRNMTLDKAIQILKSLRNIEDVRITMITNSTRVRAFEKEKRKEPSAARSEPSPGEYDETCNRAPSRRRSLLPRKGL